MDDQQGAGPARAMSTPQDESYPAYCRQRAAECRRRADQSVAGDLKAAFLDMEKMWLAAAEAPADPGVQRQITIHFSKPV
jgi:hypothetical protein